MKIEYRILLYAMIAITATSCTHNKPIDLTKETNSKTYKLGVIVSRKISSTVQLPGELKPFEEVKIFPKVNGFVKNVMVDRGSKVKSGDALIILEAPEIQAQLLTAKSKELQQDENFHISKDKYERLLVASKTEGAVSVYELTNAKSKMNADEAVANAEKSTVASLEAMKDYLTITAPFDGVISERNVHPGALVGPNAKMDLPLLKLEQQNKLRLVVYVPEVYASKINYNAKVNFILTSLPGKIMEGIINRSAGSLNAAMRSEAIEIDVLSNDNVIKPGMYAEVNIPLSSDALTYVVPASAIITSTERKYIITVENAKAKFIDVREGISKNDSTEIFGNINDNKTIIINGNNEIKNELRIYE